VIEYRLLTRANAANAQFGCDAGRRFGTLRFRTLNARGRPKVPKQSKASCLVDADIPGIVD
jgi:hypothetical protein